MKNDPETISRHEQLKHTEMCVTAKIFKDKINNRTSIMKGKVGYMKKRIIFVVTMKTQVTYLCSRLSFWYRNSGALGEDCMK